MFVTAGFKYFLRRLTNQVLWRKVGREAEEGYGRTKFQRR